MPTPEPTWTEEELQSFASKRADDAGRLARLLLASRSEIEDLKARNAELTEYGGNLRLAVARAFGRLSECVERKNVLEEALFNNDPERCGTDAGEALAALRVAANLRTERTPEGFLNFIDTLVSPEPHVAGTVDPFVRAEKGTRARDVQMRELHDAGRCIDCGILLDPGEARCFTVCSPCWDVAYKARREEFDPCDRSSYRSGPTVQGKLGTSSERPPLVLEDFASTPETPSEPT